MGSFSIWHLLLFLLIAVVIFGTTRLTRGAKDLGTAVKEFKKAMADDSDAKKTDPIQQAVDPTQPPPDVTRVARPPQPSPPGDDPRSRG